MRYSGLAVKSIRPSFPPKYTLSGGRGAIGENIGRLTSDPGRADACKPKTKFNNQALSMSCGFSAGTGAGSND
jgi:hypothetical protein